MIDLRKAVYYEYVDPVTIEIFDRYKWGLRRLGIQFSQGLLETIVYRSDHLEDTLMAFCAWVLWLKSKGETTDSQVLSDTLTNALHADRGWIPSEFQIAFLQQHRDILESPQEAIWKAAGHQLGEPLRNRLIANISEDGELILQPNIKLTEEEKQKVAAFKTEVMTWFI